MPGRSASSAEWLVRSSAVVGDGRGAHPAAAVKPLTARMTLASETDVERVAKTDDVESASKLLRPRRFPGAFLIWRVFSKDVLECTRCSGRMEIAAEA